MAEQHTNVLRTMRGIEAFNINDLEAAKQIFSENIVYRIAGRSPIAGEYCGIEQFGKVLQHVKDLSEGTLTVKPEIILADDQAVMVYSHATARREGKTLDIDQVNLYRLNEEGKVFEGRVIPIDLYAYDAFWS